MCNSFAAQFLLPEDAFARAVQGRGATEATAELVAAQYAILGNGRSAKLGWAMQDYNAQGAAGNAAAASADQGEAVLDAAGTQLALLLQGIARLPLSTVVARPGS